MPTIKDKVIATKAPRRKRRPVMARSQAQAQSIRSQWALEDGIRDVNAKVLTLAEHLDRWTALAEHDDPPTVNGMEGAEWTFFPKAGWIGWKTTTATERPSTAAYNAIITEAYQEFFRAVYAANAEREARRSELLENNRFHVPAALADDCKSYAATVSGLDRDALLALIESECEGTIETAEAIYDAQIERALALLRAQEAAIDAFEVLPTAADYQGFLAVYDDGRIKWSLTKP